MEDNKILDKLRKLQAFQKSAEEIGNEHEALNAAAKIADIIREYNVNIEELEYKDVERGITHEFIRVDVYKNIGALGVSVCGLLYLALASARCTLLKGTIRDMMVMWS